jgi:hypothetical protein
MRSHFCRHYHVRLSLSERRRFADGWRFRICAVRNAHYDGLMETDHGVLFSRPVPIYLTTSLSPIRLYPSVQRKSLSTTI